MEPVDQNSRAARLCRRLIDPQASRHFRFLCLCTASLILFHAPLRTLATLALDDSRYTFVLVIPFIAAGLLWLRRAVILSKSQYSSGPGVWFVSIGLTLAAIAVSGRFEKITLQLNVLALILVITGVFVWCYGIRAVWSSLFPLAMLLLMIPVPPNLIEHIVTALQRGSAAVSYGLFKLTGVPVLRDGTVRFLLPGVTVEVAEECSGIRSSLSLIHQQPCGWVFAPSLGLVPRYILCNDGPGRHIQECCPHRNDLPTRSVCRSRISAWPPSPLRGLPFSLLALALLGPLLMALMKAERLWNL